MILAAVAFALAHVQPVGGETFAWLPALTRTVAGCYLGLLFLGRGFGLAAGAHAAHNAAVVFWTSSGRPQRAGADKANQEPTEGPAADAATPE